MHRLEFKTQNISLSGLKTESKKKIRIIGYDDTSDSWQLVFEFSKQFLSRNDSENDNALKAGK